MQDSNQESGKARDTGLALTLVCLLAAHFTSLQWPLEPAIVLLVLTMAWPTAFKPLAPLWFGLSHLLGTVASRILLTMVFYLIATPVGVVRRLGGADSLGLKAWKKDPATALTERNHTYAAEDLEKPY